MISRACPRISNGSTPCASSPPLGVVWYFRHSYRDLDFRFCLDRYRRRSRRLRPLDRAGAIRALSGASRASPCLRRRPGILDRPAHLRSRGHRAFRGRARLPRIPAAPARLRRFRIGKLAGIAWAPLLISSVAFGILHGDRWLVGTIAGVIFALAQIRKGRIGEAIAAHAVANALVASWVLAAGAGNYGDA